MRGLCIMRRPSVGTYPRFIVGNPVRCGPRSLLGTIIESRRGMLKQASLDLTDGGRNPTDGEYNWEGGSYARCEHGTYAVEMHDTRGAIQFWAESELDPA